MQLYNPFVINGYISPEYFCDRVEESEKLVKLIQNGNNIALISPRRMGKTGLIQHCFHTSSLKNDYYTFFTDIYATKSLKEFICSLGHTIVDSLKPCGKKALEAFWNHVRTLQAGITFDPVGNPSFTVQPGEIRTPEKTLDEIFGYLNSAGKPCIVAIDEFQQIEHYPEKNTEALLRTYIQQTPNANFIFAGSQLHTMGMMFTSASRPFYQSVTILHLGKIDCDKYTGFAVRHFASADKNISESIIREIYETFEGTTWYMQKMLNVIYSMTPAGEDCSADSIETALQNILDTMKYVYEEILFRLPEKQKGLLIAIAKEDKAAQLTSGNFIRKYSLASASSVQSALRALVEKEFVTQENGKYSIHDKFFRIWLDRTY